MAASSSDEILYEQLTQGNLGALDVLYARYQRHLFGFIFAQLGDRAEAEDVLHDTFLAVLREGRVRRAPTCFRAWIYQVARNLCLNRARSRQRATRAVQAAAHVAVVSPDEPEVALLAAHSGEALRRAVARLPSPLAELFQLRAGGLSSPPCQVPRLAEGGLSNEVCCQARPERIRVMHRVARDPSSSKPASPRGRRGQPDYGRAAVGGTASQ